jgi:hypothetical protein
MHTVPTGYYPVESGVVAATKRSMGDKSNCNKVEMGGEAGGEIGAQVVVRERGC